MTHRTHLEAFNRATHSDALPEMQLAPAESIQPVEHPFRRAVSPWIYCPAWAALIAILTVIGVHKL